MAVWKRLCERRGAVASQRPPADISFNHHRLLKTWFTVYLSLTPYHLFPLSVSPALSFPLSLSLTHRHTLSLSLSLSPTLYPLHLCSSLISCLFLPPVFTQGYITFSASRVEACSAEKCDCDVSPPPIPHAQAC